MSLLELTRTVTVEVDDVVDLADLEQAALAFARTAPARLVGDTVVGLMESLLDAIVGRRGDPIAPECQPEAPWVCPRCGSRRGFRRRGFRAPLAG